MNEYNESFTHDGKDFDIRVAEGSNEYIVKVFLDGKPLSGVNYSISFEVEGDYYHQHKESFINNLVSIAKSDVENGITYKP